MSDSKNPKNSAECLLYLFPNSEPLTDWVVSDNGGKITISGWNSELGEQPTFEELNSVSAIAKKTAHFKTIRKKRNRLLAETDWWASSDLVITDGQKKYRKSLRDLPASNTDPEKIIFPEKPE
jgi:hypothetical protein